MKLSVYALVLCAGLSLSTAQAFSLYDVAPQVGLTADQDIKYSAYVSLGIDDNVNGSPSDKQESIYTRFGMNATKSLSDSRRSISWNASVGGTLYSETADSTDDSVFADISLALTLKHVIDEKSSNTLNMRLSITPESDYSNGISSANREGDSLNWNLSDQYSRQLDSRKSMVLSAGYSGNIYLNDMYKVDDREYLTCSGTLRYQQSTLTSYSLSLSSQFDFRRYGFDSENVYMTAGMQKTLDAYSSIGVTLGAQLKFIDGDTGLYPTFNFAYRRKFSKGISASAYIGLKNENIDTYTYSSGGGVNYLSDMSWRIGGNLSKPFSDKITGNTGCSIILAQYRDGTNSGSDRDESTYNLYLGATYKINNSTNFSLRYSYTIAEKDTGDYDRNLISGTLTYSF